jgi:hypothetical protein
MLAQRRRVKAEALAYGHNFPDDRPLDDPLYAGWVHWAAFHLDPPSATREILTKSDQYASIQYIMTRFSVHALLSRSGMSTARFEYLTTFVIYVSADRKSQHVVFDKSTLQATKFSSSKAFVMQVTAVQSEGFSQTATLWVEGGILEIFNPWLNRSPLMNRLVTEHVGRFLQQKWMKDGGDPQRPPPQTFEYNLPESLDQSNTWNTYFIFLRSAHSRDAVVNAFSPAHAKPASLIERRDLVMQTCGRIIAGCAKHRDSSAHNQNYREIFGPDARPFPFNRENIEVEFPNIFTRCTLPENKLWNNFDDLLPDPVNGKKEGASEWPKDTDPKWKNFMHLSTAKTMKFVHP